MTEIPQRLLKFSEGDDPAAGVILTILIPFAAYVVAKRIGCSGILAAVSAGMMMNIQSRATAFRGARAHVEHVDDDRVRFQRDGVLLLGLQLPHVIGQALIEAHHDGNAQVGLLIGYMVATVLALCAAFRVGVLAALGRESQCGEAWHRERGAGVSHAGDDDHRGGGAAR